MRETSKRRDRKRERKGREKKRFSRHSDDLRRKVDPRIASYAWVPKLGVLSSSTR